MALALILVPLALAGVALLVRSNRWRPLILPLGGAIHLVLMIYAVSGPPVSALDDWLVLDPLGKVVLVLISTLFFFCAIYAPGYLRQRPERNNRVLCACLLTSLSMMTLVILSHHLGLMWVAIEATTLTTAPSIYFNHNARSLEATWKYLLVCSVGIALALLGSFFLAYSALHSSQPPTLFFEGLIAEAPNLSLPWLQAAFVLLLIGYGTKMGLAPMHTWKPDVYGEAPGLVGALMAGGMTSCAFLAILRFYQILEAAEQASFAKELLIVLGLLSMTFGAIFMVRQRDFKRMLAYSSVEHMGILVLGIGIGGLAVYGSLLHMINNGLTKGVLFLSAGNIHRSYGSKTTDEVRGAMHLLPVSGTLFLIGFLAITGSPPFAPFVSEFTIISAALGQGSYIVGGLILLLMAIVFIGMGSTVLAVVQGEPSERALKTHLRERFATAAPIVVLMALVLLLGLLIPALLEALLRDAAAFVEGKS